MDAYLTKPLDSEELIAVVVNLLSRVERTSAELSRLVSSAMGEERMETQLPMDKDFTEAEARVARLVASGLTNKEIAAALSISVRTVEGHISNILSKKGWSNRVEIARHIFERGGLTVKSVIREGEAKSVLMAEAESWGADSIFVGSRGLDSALKRFLLGGVSSAVVANATCSVEVVR